MSEEKKVSLSAEVLAMSEKMQKHFTVDKATGVGTEDDTYAKVIPDNLSPEIIKAVSDFNVNYIAAGAHVVGLAGVKAMKDNKKLDQVTAEFKMNGRDTVSYTMDRKVENKNSFKPGETVTKFGAISTSIDIRAGKAGAQLKNARKIINDLAAEQLK